MSRKTLKTLFIVSVLVILTSACSAATSKRVDWVCVNHENEFDCRYTLFSGQETENINLRTGEILAISFDVEVESGELQMILMNDSEEPVWKITLKESLSDVTSYQATENGDFYLVIKGMDAAGSFNITWQILE